MFEENQKQIPIYFVSANTIYLNVAIDEAIFLLGKQEAKPCLRVWQQTQPAIVLGRSQKPELEINLEACKKENIPIARRCSAGGTVLQGYGSINFVFNFPITWDAVLSDVRKSFQYFAEYIQQALAIHSIPSGYRLLSDITNGQEKKISGNAQSRSIKTILHHGTLLIKPMHEEMLKYLSQPSSEPEYRQGRSHCDFVTSLEEMGYFYNINQLAEDLLKVIPQSYITTELPSTILEKAEELLKTKYLTEKWNLQGQLP